MSKTVILTGFEPFGNSEVNPSILACQAFDGENMGGYSIQAFEIPLVFNEIKEKIVPLLEKKPNAIICTGQSPRAMLSLERVAINIADVSRTAYNCETKPTDEILEDNGPAGYFTTLPIRKLKKSLEKNNIPCEISNSAGAFGCNQIFYHLMHYIAEKKVSIPAGFIHVPSLPEQVIGKNIPSMSLDTIKSGLRIILQTLIDELESNK
ncbi:MAG: pyroglutamyl-peptidase I [Candidatus Heimdallarchaeota archaeon]|nr:pyroglutamyl-peptidase I [Candidatus Heimdallarchaeota archaeon]MCK4768862.1 pyroglutamyl-peptidase I [Candidatus Heimdallarchaeota archaeon]